MSARRSGRSKAPVKYTSDSSGSDFSDTQATNKPKKSSPKKRAATSPQNSSTPKKRTKKDLATLAAEHKEKAAQQEAKAESAAHKKSWEAWVEKHDAGGVLLNDEPGKDVSITQTDAGKKYGVKKEDLVVLKHFEKKNPLYGNTMKVYVESEVRELGFRKAGVLAGEEAEGEGAVGKGEKIWEEEHKDDPEDKHEEKPASKSSAQTPKKKWAAFVDDRVGKYSDDLEEEPEKSINQTDSTKKYKLSTKELATLSYFGKPNPKYGNTTKLFRESDVEVLAWRKAALLGAVEEEDEGKLLEKGRELWEEHGAADGEVA